jgi:antitoxin component of MazEF toxin-antitoxin module
MPASSERHILAIGSSKAVALPPDWLHAFNLDVGDKIEVVYNTVVIIKPVALSLANKFLHNEFRHLQARKTHHMKRSDVRIHQPVPERNKRQEGRQ